MSDLLARLSAPFPPAMVSWRVGSITQDKTRGMALAYIDARDVQDRLNEVCGHEWQVRHPWSTADGKLACEIGIKIDGEWLWRGDGAGNSDVEAEKGAFSDSFKRAAVRWGIGRYLYDIDSPWVALEQRGKSYVIAAGELSRLRGILSGVRQTEAPARPTAAPAYRPANPPPPDHQGRTVNSIQREATAALVDAKSIARVNEIKEMYKDTWAEIDKIKPAVSNNLRILAETRIKELAAAEHRANELTNPRMPEEDQFTAMDHRI